MRVVTLGYQHLCKLYPSTRAYTHGMKNQRPQDVDEETVKRVIRTSTFAAVVYNCLEVGTATKHLRDHTGYHPSILESASGSRAFGRILEHVLSALANWDPDSGSDLVLAFWCKSGRHRSVATALLCAAVLGQRSEAPVDVSHTCSLFRPMTHRSCSICTGFAPDTFKRAEMIADLP